MIKLQVGDRVKISPTVTACPWRGKLTGVILFSDDDSVAVEVESDEKLGHGCVIGGYIGKAENGWWFMQNELELITKEESSKGK